jgi:hypothetical protein
MKFATSEKIGLALSPVPTPPSLTETYIRNRRRAESISSCGLTNTNGTAEMPPFRELADEHPIDSFSIGQTRQYIQQDAAECWGVLMRHAGPAASLFEIHLRATSNAIAEREDVDDRLRCHIGTDTTFIEMDGEIFAAGAVAHVHREITKLPKYLAIQTIRFFFRIDENTPTKITRAVELPIRLEVRKWVTEDVVAPNYALKAFITHRGRARNCGYYVAHVREDGEWYRYDDEKVSVVEEEKIQCLKGDPPTGTAPTFSYMRQSRWRGTGVCRAP